MKNRDYMRHVYEGLADFTVVSQRIQQRISQGLTAYPRGCMLLGMANDKYLEALTCLLRGER
jgi:hypothetical protein